MVEKYDCDVCLSAGSVNQWGCCEICGEDFEDPESRVEWRNNATTWSLESVGSQGRTFTPFGQDAA